MSGILNNKTRIMDTVLTTAGKRQLADGKLVIKFVTFTDGATFYEADAVSGSAETSSRLMLEPATSPHDIIAFQADDSGRLVAGPINNQFRVGKGQFYADTTDKRLQVLSGTQFASNAHGIISSSIDNFRNLYTIGTSGFTSFVAEEGFDLSPDEITFTVTPDLPIQATQRNVKNLDTMASLAFDDHLAHVPNFMFMPPVNKQTAEVPYQSQLGRFVPGGSVVPLTTQEVDTRIRAADDAGYLKTVDFTVTSRQNNTFLQMFEIREGLSEVVKLDLVEFGRYKTSDPKFPDRHVFFAGRVLQDSLGRHTFVHLFTLVFE
jgi:hypothetical protein